MRQSIPDSMRGRFIQRCSGDLQKLREIRDRPRGLGGGTVDETFVRTVHGLAGAGGTFGFSEVSRRACDLESFLIDKDGAPSDRRRALEALIATLESLTEK